MIDANAALVAGDFLTALTGYAKILSSKRKIGDESRAYVGCRMALCKIRSGDLAGAEADLEGVRAALDRARLGWSKLQADFLAAHAEIAYERRNYEAAKTLFGNALDIEGKTQPHRAIRVAQLLLGLAWAEVQLLDLRASRQHLSIAEDTLRSRDDCPQELCQCLYLAGVVSMLDGHPEKARSQLLEAEQMHFGSPRQRARILTKLGWASLRSGEIAEAAHAFAEAQSATAAEPSGLSNRFARASAAALLARQDEPEEAVAAFADVFGLPAADLSKGGQERVLEKRFSFISTEPELSGSCDGEQQQIRLDVDKLNVEDAELAEALTEFADTLRKSGYRVRLCCAKELLKQSQRIFKHLRLEKTGAGMAPVALSGWISCALDRHEEAVAELTRYRTWSGSSDHEESADDGLAVAALLRAGIALAQWEEVLTLRTEVLRYKNILGKEPLEFDPDYLNAVCRFYQGEYKFALDHLMRVDPATAEHDRADRKAPSKLAFARGLCQLGRGKWKDAEAALVAAQVGPEFSSACWSRCLARARALARWGQGKSFDLKRMDSESYRGKDSLAATWTFLRENRFTEAKLELEKLAVRSKGSDLTLSDHEYLQVARLLMWLESYDEARELLTRRLEELPRQGGEAERSTASLFRAMVADSYLREGALENARKLLAELATSSPAVTDAIRRPVIWQCMGMYSLADGRTWDAQSYLSRAACCAVSSCDTDDLEFAEVCERLSLVSSARGQFRPARCLLSFPLQILPSTEPLLLAAAIEQHLGDLPAARRFLTRADSMMRAMIAGRPPGPDSGKMVAHSGEIRPRLSGNIRSMQAGNPPAKIPPSVRRPGPAAAKPGPATGLSTPNSSAVAGDGTGRLKRWSASSFPLRVYVGNETGTRENRRILHHMVQESLSRWRDASGGKISFTLVDLPTAANLYFSFRKTPISTPHGYSCSGYCRVESVRGSGEITWCQVVVPGLNGVIERLPLTTQDEIHSTVLHEVGHALGLSHSSDPGDVMYPFHAHERVLSPRDRSRVRSLYGE